VRERLGEPAVVRGVGRERWLVYALDDLSLRLRLETGSEAAVVRSWTVTFRPGQPSFEGACEAVGVRPSPGDDLDGTGRRRGASGPGMIRRRLPDASTARIHSLTARTRAGRIRSLTAFDEPPDWRPGPEAP